MPKHAAITPYGPQNMCEGSPANDQLTRTNIKNTDRGKEHSIQSMDRATPSGMAIQYLLAAWLINDRSAGILEAGGSKQRAAWRCMTGT